MKRNTAAYVVPFLVFVTLMSVEGWAGWSPRVGYPLRSFAALAAWCWLSRGLFPLRPQRALPSVLVGLGVFLVWIGPDLAWPGYRNHWLFCNPLVGRAQSSMSEELRSDVVFLVLRAAGSALVVPLIEEWFWRAWLMRWLTGKAVEEVPLGACFPRAFWLTAVLFGLEHGPFWDVGVVAGAAYNWWLVRTRSLADCVLAHGVTNACLAVWVIGTGAWAYWG
ncbi:MAG: CAAX prenyl protease-related protein [Bryobacterales bacterium]|nr:CAAX prenyl protease-related protein [Bryobacteraceae bacterium]MDW8130182.1 CAAX prenyl protease-related protein [Bryobacterales bacterium]